MHPEPHHRSSMVKTGERYVGLGLAVLGFAGVFILFGPEALALGAIALLVITARRRVEVKGARSTNLWMHAGVFVVVNTYLVGRDLVSGEGVGVALWVIVIWGIALAIHAHRVVWAIGGADPAPRVEEARSRERLRL